MKRVGLWAMGIGLFITVGFLTMKQGYAEEEDHAPTCTLETLQGTYVFAATGFNTHTVDGTVPKAIVESIVFDGEGMLKSLATRSLNGTITGRLTDPVGSGSYTVADNCTGTITFGVEPNAVHHDIFIAPNGKEYYWVQTDLNTVIAGVARRVSHDDADHDHE